MKLAWRTDNVSCVLLGPGFFSFSFKSETEKKKVLDTGPWFFSSNLLVLQRCDPDIPDRVTMAVVREIASKIGEVLEVNQVTLAAGCELKSRI